MRYPFGMPEDTDAIGPTLSELLDGALRPLFGDNLPAYYAEVERHQVEAAELGSVLEQ